MADAHKTHHGKPCSLDQIEKIKKAIRELNTAKGKSKKSEAYVISKLIGESEELFDFPNDADETSITAALSAPSLEAVLNANGYIRDTDCTDELIMDNAWYTETGDIILESFVALRNAERPRVVFIDKHGYEVFYKKCAPTPEALIATLKEAYRKLGVTDEVISTGSTVAESTDLPDFPEDADEASVNAALHSDDIEYALRWNRFEKMDLRPEESNVWVRYEPDGRGIEYTFKVYYNPRTGNMFVQLLKNGFIAFERRSFATKNNLIRLLRAAAFETGLGLPIHESADLPDFPEEDTLPLPDSKSDEHVTHVLADLGFRKEKGVHNPEGYRYVYEQGRIQISVEKYKSDNVNYYLIDDTTPATHSAFAHDIDFVPEHKLINKVKWLLNTYARQNADPTIQQIRQMSVGEMRAELQYEYAPAAGARPTCIGLLARKRGLPLSVLTEREFYAAYYFHATNLRGEAPAGVKPVAAGENVHVGQHPANTWSYISSHFGVGTEVVLIPATDVASSKASNYVQTKTVVSPKPEDVKVITAEVMTEKGPDLYRLFTAS